MKIFSGSSNKPLTEKVAERLGLSVAPVENFVFPDGERRIQVQVNVLDEDAVIVQSTNPPVDSHYLELFLLVDSLKRSGARNVTVVMPYMGYMRQDHIFRSGEAVSLSVMINILESLKVDRFLGLDFHTVKVPEFFHIPVESLSALPMFAEDISERGWNTEESVLISPDMGGLRRINKMSELLGQMPWTATVKDRDLDTGSIAISSFDGPFPVEELDGKRALIVDDMISSGRTIVQSAELLKKNGVRECYVYVSHPIFSAEAPSLLQNSSVDGVFVTDSVFVPQEKRFVKLEILSIADMIAGELRSNS